MCNAWNHQVGCGCGFGGVWCAESNVCRWQDDYSKLLETFTVQTSCPECGVLVFFYQSPYGGKVFFDSLGKPWPRHSCTTNVVNTETAIKEYQPCIINNIRCDQKGYVLQIDLILDGHLMRIDIGDNYIIRKNFYGDIMHNNSKKTQAFIRKEWGNYFYDILLTQLAINGKYKDNHIQPLYGYGEGTKPNFSRC